VQISGYHLSQLDRHLGPKALSVFCSYLD
jgi:hypothetical protein